MVNLVAEVVEESVVDGDRRVLQNGGRDDDGKNMKLITKICA